MGVNTNYQNLIEKIYGMPIKEILRELYLNQELPAGEIAKQFGVSHTTVHRWLREFDFHYRRPVWNKGLSKEEMQRIVDMNK